MAEDRIHVVLGEEDADHPFASDPRDQAHESRAFARCHARGGLVHQQELGIVGQRDGELEPFDIAIRELAATARGLVRHADQGEKVIRLLPIVAGRPSATFSATVIDPKVAAIWNVRPTPSRQMSRAAIPVTSRSKMRMRPPLGSSCPLIMLKQVLLPAPLGPISASISPACKEKVTPFTA